MNANLLFAVSALLLAGMYLFFKPISVERPQNKEVAQLDLQTFTIYELDRGGLIRVMYGDEGKRFADRYEVTNIAYSDSRDEVTQDMTADFGTYRGDTVTLTGHVLVRRSDGADIKAEKASYNQETGIIKSYGPFYMVQNGNSARGRDLVYDMNTHHVKAKSITASYLMPNQGNRE